MREPREPVLEDALVDDLVEPPARLRVDHREHEPVAAPAEVEPGLGLDDHRQVVRQVERTGAQELPAERAHGQLETARIARPRPSTARRRSRARRRRRSARPCRSRSSTPELDRAAHELARHRGRIGARRRSSTRRRRARRRRSRPRTDRGSTRSTGTPSPRLELAPLLELVQSFLGRREEEVADLVEEGRPSDSKKRIDSCASTTSAAVENCWRTPPIAFAVAPDRDLAAVHQDDVALRRAREVVRDRGADRARTRYDDSSHRSSSSRSSSRQRPQRRAHVLANRHAASRDDRA